MKALPQDFWFMVTLIAFAAHGDGRAVMDYAGSR